MTDVALGHVMELLGADHDTRCCNLDSLQLHKQTVADTVQQTVAVVKTAADECVQLSSTQRWTALSKLFLNLQQTSSVQC